MRIRDKKKSQDNLNLIFEYAETWKLDINVEKYYLVGEMVISGSGRIRK